MEESFGVASFRSRQQVMSFERTLRRLGLPVEVITTPRAVALGCGLSVRFRLEDARDVLDVYHMHQPGNLIGFYRADRVNGQVRVTPMGV
ncbi:MAG: DUF3343 domain-containing protein [Clostridia bacterium]|nr:DUF3343 domain-containing protein [Clostridia bacterium]